MKKLLVGMLLLSLVATGALAGGQKEAAKTGAVDELVVGVSEAWTATDVQYWVAIECFMQLGLIYTGLLEFDKDMQFVPGLAERWTISDDALQYTFNLRKGVKWHNGRELVASDVKFSIERELGWIPPNKEGLFRASLGDVKKVDVLDEYTVRVTLNQAYAPFLYGVTSGWCPVVCPENFGPDGKINENEIIGTGPYKFVELVMDDYFKVERNDQYFAGKPAVKTIVFKQIPDATVRLTALKAGDIQMMLNPKPEDFLAYTKSPAKEYVLAEIPGSTVWAYSFNLNVHEKPFENKLVRQAVAHAINVDEYITIITSGIGTESTNIWADGNFWHSDVPRLKYDVELAKKLLAQAGYPSGFETEIHTVDFVNLSKNAEILQSQLSKIGVRATISKPDFAQWAKEEGNSEFKIHTQCWNYTDDPTQHYGISLESGCVYPSWYGGGWTTPEIDRLLAEAKAISNVETRRELYEKVNAVLVDESVVIQLYTTPALYGVSGELSDMEWNVRGDFIHSLDKGIMNLTYK
ncbi:ABC transporter substrate-binding protein [Candidatus Bipolaricaulota bacterium]|nr:ABC transporter substrate-binding protein [Candidatus Bipolaricaulota bacterium]